VCFGSSDLSGVEPIADAHALHRLDAHQREGEPGVQLPVELHVRPEARRRTVRQYLEHAAEGVPGPLGLVDHGDHPLRGRGIGGPHG
jgi:hypothetical protein